MSNIFIKIEKFGYKHRHTGRTAREDTEAPREGRQDGHGKMVSKTGVKPPQTKKCLGLLDAVRGKEAISVGAQREHGPANTSTLDL